MPSTAPPGAGQAHAFVCLISDMQRSPAALRLKGHAYVAVQFACLAALALTGPVLPPSPTGRVLAGAGLALGAWAVFAMRRSRWRVHPLPAPEARLVTLGPYARIRHPMYLSVLLLAAGWCVGHPTGPRLIAWGVLLADLLLKARLEEAALADRFPEYRAYQSRSGLIVPKLF